MYDFSFGDISLTRIVEMELPMLEAKTFFPDWDEAAIGKAHRMPIGWCPAITGPTPAWSCWRSRPS